MDIFVLYLFAGCVSFGCTFVSLPVLRGWLGKHLLDAPGGLKTHTRAVPTLGGCGILMGLVAALVIIRLITHFPSGTLHSLRGIILGATLIFIMGLWDDFKKPAGLSIAAKLGLQAAATVCLIYYGIFIRVFPNAWVAYALTFLWVVGLTNAFNLLDVQDGLCTTQAIACTLGLAFIALPSEFIYVNFAALALLGACMAFLPFNFSAKRKLFLGDSGANLLGFLIAALCLATGYSQTSNWGFLAPLLIIAVPLTDICFVTWARLKQGKNPLKGSPDHAALRLQAAGWSGRRILGVFTAAGLLCNVLGYVVTVCPPTWVPVILAATAAAAVTVCYKLFLLGTPHAR